MTRVFLLLPLLLPACNLVPRDGPGYLPPSAKDFGSGPSWSRGDEIGVWTENQPYDQGINALVLDGEYFVVQTGGNRLYGGRYTWQDDGLLILEPDDPAYRPPYGDRYGRLRLSGPDRLVVTGLPLDPLDPDRTRYTLYRNRR